jgi:putative ABC transport system permease protein
MSRLANSIQNYFKIKFGSSIQIWGKENVEMQNQMKTTLAIFQILLISISIITLFVGGMGLTNLMLASVNERFREIGVRKAVGASDGSILMLFLSETVFLCLISGAIGVVLGLTVFHALLWFGSEFTHKLTFTWIIDWSALSLSVVATLCVGVISGVFPAVKAQRLSVIEALRTD